MTIFAVMFMVPPDDALLLILHVCEAFFTTKFTRQKIISDRLIFLIEQLKLSLF